MPWSPISEARETPLLAKQIRLQCPHCYGQVFVVLPYKPTSTKRTELIQEAINEHRRVCTVADVMDGFVYTIEYPRS